MKCARYTAWTWQYLDNLHYIQGNISWAILYFGIHIPSPEIWVLMYCHYALGTSCEIVPCFHIWVSKGLVPMCYCHPAQLLIQFADKNSETNWQQWQILEQRMTEPRAPGDNLESNAFTDQPRAPITSSDSIHLHGVQTSRLEPTAKNPGPTFLTELKVKKPWDPGVLKPILILSKAYYPAPFSWNPSSELPFHCNLLLLAWTLLKKKFLHIS